MIIIVSIILKVLAIAVILFIVYLKLDRWYSRYDKTNIRGPEPVYFLGNLLELAIIDRWVLAKKWLAKHDRIFAYYNGFERNISMGDLKSIKKLEENPHQAKNMDFQELNCHCRHLSNSTDRWPGLMRPKLTIRQLEYMRKRVKKFLDSTMEAFITEVTNGGNKSSNVINIQEPIDSIMLQLCGLCFLGRKPIMNNNGELEFPIIKLDDLLSQDHLSRLVWNISNWPSQYRSQLSLLLINRIKGHGYLVSEMDDFIMGMINERRATTGTKVTNMIHFLLEPDYANEPDCPGGSTDQITTWTNEFLLEQIKMSIFATYEFASASMANILYALSFHPEIQQKLHQELLRAEQTNDITKKKKDNSENKNNKQDSFLYSSCEYLDAVIFETLRMMPVVSQQKRELSQPFYLVLPYNFILKEGTSVQINVASIHHDPEYWPQPDRFDPGRFMGSRKNSIIENSFIPFGYQSSASGSSFSPKNPNQPDLELIILRIWLSNMIRRFQFEQPESEHEPTFSLAGTRESALNVTRRQVTNLKLTERLETQL